MQLILHMDPPRPAPPAAPSKDLPEHAIRDREAQNRAELAASDEVLTTREVVRITKRHRATLFRWERSGAFPKKRTFKGGKRGWLRSDVERWMTGDNGTDVQRGHDDVH